MDEDVAMARKAHLPANLTPTQVTELQDALLANANQLLESAVAMLDANMLPQARSLAILGMEESGKAIALHERRVQMAHAPEGESFVNARLESIWAIHGKKLEVVHNFLVNEDYWFGVEPADPEDNARALGALEDWRADHNTLKMRGFYVDVSPDGSPVKPEDSADAEAVRMVMGYVHQIGWQLRLGEHIEGKRRLERERGVAPSTAEEIKHMRDMFSSDDDSSFLEGLLESMREGRPGERFNNAEYRFASTQAFANVGRPGYEAEDRELRSLASEVFRENKLDFDLDI
jgi:AbiV family abortive infection protein